MILPRFIPTSLMLALWPTQDFLFPAVASEFARRLREQFPAFTEERLVQAAEGTALPPEMPRFALMAGGQWQLELAPARVNLHLRNYNPAPPAGDRLPTHLLPLWFEAFHAQLLPIQAWLAENHGLRVYRTGCIVQLFCETRSSANEKIAHYFLQPRALQGQALHEAQLGMLTKLALPGQVLVNRWLRVQPLRSLDPSHVDFAAQVEIDINTLAEDTRLRGAREVAQFLSAVQQHLENDLPLLQDESFFA